MKPQNKKNRYFNYYKYSGIAMQMAVIISIGVFGGYYSDKFLNLRYPIFTVILSIASVAIAIYLVTKDLMK